MLNQELENILEKSDIQNVVHFAMTDSINVSTLYLSKQIGEKEYRYMLNETRDIISNILFKKFSTPSLN